MPLGIPCSQCQTWESTKLYVHEGLVYCPECWKAYKLRRAIKLADENNQGPLSPCEGEQAGA